MDRRYFPNGNLPRTRSERVERALNRFVRSWSALLLLGAIIFTAFAFFLLDYGTSGFGIDSLIRSNEVVLQYFPRPTPGNGSAFWESTGLLPHEVAAAQSATGVVTELTAWVCVLILGFSLLLFVWVYARNRGKAKQPRRTATAQCCGGRESQSTDPSLCTPSWNRQIIMAGFLVACSLCAFIHSYFEFRPMRKSGGTLGMGPILTQQTGMVLNQKIAYEMLFSLIRGEAWTVGLVRDAGAGQFLDSPGRTWVGGILVAVVVAFTAMIGISLSPNPAAEATLKSRRNVVLVGGTLVLLLGEGLAAIAVSLADISINGMVIDEGLKAENSLRRMFGHAADNSWNTTTGGGAHAYHNDTSLDPLVYGQGGVPQFFLALHTHAVLRGRQETTLPERHRLHRWAEHSEMQDIVPFVANDLTASTTATWCLTLASTAESSAAIVGWNAVQGSPAATNASYVVKSVRLDSRQLGLPQSTEMPIDGAFGLPLPPLATAMLGVQMILAIFDSFCAVVILLTWAATPVVGMHELVRGASTEFAAQSKLRAEKQSRMFRLSVFIGHCFGACMCGGCCVQQQTSAENPTEVSTESIDGRDSKYVQDTGYDVFETLFVAYGSMVDALLWSQATSCCNRDTRNQHATGLPRHQVGDSPGSSASHSFLKLIVPGMIVLLQLRYRAFRENLGGATMECACGYARELGLLSFTACSTEVLNMPLEEIIGSQWRSRVDDFMASDIVVTLAFSIVRGILLIILYDSVQKSDALEDEIQRLAEQKQSSRRKLGVVARALGSAQTISILGRKSSTNDPEAMARVTAVGSAQALAQCLQEIEFEDENNKGALRLNIGEKIHSYFHLSSDRIPRSGPQNLGRPEVPRVKIHNGVSQTGPVLLTTKHRVLVEALVAEAALLFCSSGDCSQSEGACVPVCAGIASQPPYVWDAEQWQSARLSLGAAAADSLLDCMRHDSNGRQLDANIHTNTGSQLFERGDANGEDLQSVEQPTGKPSKPDASSGIMVPDSSDNPLKPAKADSVPRSGQSNTKSRSAGSVIARSGKQQAGGELGTRFMHHALDPRTRGMAVGGSAVEYPASMLPNGGPRLIQQEVHVAPSTVAIHERLLRQAATAGRAVSGNSDGLGQRASGHRLVCVWVYVPNSERVRDTGRFFPQWDPKLLARRPALGSSEVLRRAALAKLAMQSGCSVGIASDQRADYDGAGVLLFVWFHIADVKSPRSTEPDVVEADSVAVPAQATQLLPAGAKHSSADVRQLSIVVSSAPLRSAVKCTLHAAAQHARLRGPVEVVASADCHDIEIRNTAPDIVVTDSNRYSSVLKAIVSASSGRCERVVVLRHPDDAGPLSEDGEQNLDVVLLATPVSERALLDAVGV